MSKPVVWHDNLRWLFDYMWKNKWIRESIRAPIDQTILYCGYTHFRDEQVAVWKYIESLRAARKAGTVARFVTLNETLNRIYLPARHQTLLDFINTTERDAKINPAQKVIWDDNEPRIWRLLSAIFATNAQGQVHFMIGSGLDYKKTVFAMTEIHALAGNHQIGPEAKKDVAMLMKCIQSRQIDINYFSLPVR